MRRWSLGSVSVVDPQLQDAVRRATRRAAWIAAVGGLVGLAVGLWLGVGDDGGVEPYRVVATVLGAAMAIGGLGAALSIFVAQFRMRSMTNAPLAGLDSAGKRAVQAAVFSGVPVTPHDSVSARRTAGQARVLAATLPLATVQYALLFCGITGSQVLGLGSSDGWASWVRIALIVVLVVTGVVATVQLHRNAVRVRRTVAEVDGAS